MKTILLISIVAISLILLVGIGYGGYVVYQKYKNNNPDPPNPPSPPDPPAKKVPSAVTDLIVSNLGMVESGIQFEATWSQPETLNADSVYYVYSVTDSKGEILLNGRVEDDAGGMIRFTIPNDYTYATADFSVSAVNTNGAGPATIQSFKIWEGPVVIAISNTVTKIAELNILVSIFPVFNQDTGPDRPVALLALGNVQLPAGAWKQITETSWQLGWVVPFNTFTPGTQCTVTLYAVSDTTGKGPTYTYKFYPKVSK